MNNKIRNLDLERVMKIFLLFNFIVFGYFCYHIFDKNVELFWVKFFLYPMLSVAFSIGCLSFISLLGRPENKNVAGLFSVFTIIITFAISVFTISIKLIMYILN